VGCLNEVIKKYPLGCRFFEVCEYIRGILYEFIFEWKYVD